MEKALTGSSDPSPDLVQNVLCLIMTATLTNGVCYSYVHF